MLRVLFWNINKKDLREAVCQAAKAQSADVVILLESGITQADTLAALREGVSSDFRCPRAIPGRFQLYARRPELGLEEVFSSDRLSLRRLSQEGTELILGVVHVVDRRNWDEPGQMLEVHLLAEELRRQEERWGHARTVLVGDFNMNPFAQAMNKAAGMNAMMTRRCVERGSRVQQQREYRYFYNPMWGLFGDRTDGPAGTYYHSSASQGHFGWNMLDQLLVRPDALKWFENVFILNRAGDLSLETPAGRPSSQASDHFPLLITLR